MTLQGVVTLIYARVTALTRLLAQYTKEGVELLHILTYYWVNGKMCVW